VQRGDESRDLALRKSGRWRGVGELPFSDESFGETSAIQRPTSAASVPTSSAVR
jgi:hypothetical protein